MLLPKIHMRILWTRSDRRAVHSGQQDGFLETLEGDFLPLLCIDAVECLLGVGHTEHRKERRVVPRVPSPFPTATQMKYIVADVVF